MKEIVVISGKGGTGKTSLTASFAVLGGADLVVADCDVDAADLHMLLEPDFAVAEDFFAGEQAVIDAGICSACGRCSEVCRFDAIEVVADRYAVRELACEGCGYCARVCPEGAITNIRQPVGSWYRSGIRTGSDMIHARLKIGADNSGKLVTRVKSEARSLAERSGRDLVLVDGSPGIGCPVVSSLSGATVAILVTEPTVSGLHDLKRVYELVKTFGILTGCIINKADLNDEVLSDLRAYLWDESIHNLAEIPYDEAFAAAIVNGRTVCETDSGLSAIIEECWSRVMTLAAAG